MLLLALIALPSLSYTGPVIHPSSDWQEVSFPGAERGTEYTLCNEDGFAALHARSNSSASSLCYPLALDPGQLPIVTWMWKVTALYDNADPLKKTGDDFPARLIVGFAESAGERSVFHSVRRALSRILGGPPVPDRALVYVWASRLPVEASFDSPYTDRCRIIVVESGAGNLDLWVSVRRNIARDYMRAFGGPAPPVTGIAIMSDSDNTGESTSAYYGKISFDADAPPHPGR